MARIGNQNRNLTGTLLLVGGLTALLLAAASSIANDTVSGQQIGTGLGNTLSSILVHLPAPLRENIMGAMLLAFVAGAGALAWRTFSGNRTNNQRNREKLEFALEFGIDAIWEWDFKNDVITVESVHASSLGLNDRKVHLSKAEWDQLLHPDEWPTIDNKINAMRTGVSQNFEAEHRLKNASGTWIWLLAQGKVTRYDKDGVPLRVEGVHFDITARKRSESALEKKAHDLDLSRRLTKSINWEIDAASGEITTSGEVANIVGAGYVNLADNIRSIAQTVHPDDAEALSNKLYRLRKTRASAKGGSHLHRHEYRAYVDKEKTQIAHMLCLIEVAANDEGMPILLRGITQDVTELRETEAALHDSESMFRAITENSFAFTAICDRDFNYVYASPSILTAAGKTLEELIGRSPELHPDDIFRVKAALKLLEGKPETTIELFDCRIATVNGWAPTDAYLTNMLDVPGVTGYVVHAIDISARKAAERKDEETQLKYQKLISTTDTGYVVTDKNGVVIECNDLYAQLAGYKSCDDIIGHPAAEWVCPVDLPRVATTIADCRGDDIPRLVEMKFIHGDGTEIEVEFTPVGIDTADGWRLFALCRDITERKKANEKQHQSQKLEMIGQLTGGIAHDFNNLLAVVIGNMEMIQDEARQEERPQSRLLDNALTAAQKGASLVQSLLGFARKQELQPRETDVNCLIRELEPLISQTFGSNIEVNLNLPDDLWHPVIDPNRLESALLNLGVNARDAMPKGGTLTYSAENRLFSTLDTNENDAASGERETGEGAPCIVISVHDEGVGIADDIKHKIFEPFFTTKEGGKGSGLGLSMIYGFIKQSGGSIKVESEEGSGTTISLTLPCNDVTTNANDRNRQIDALPEPLQFQPEPLNKGAAE